MTASEPRSPAAAASTPVSPAGRLNQSAAARGASVALWRWSCRLLAAALILALVSGLFAAEPFLFGNNWQIEPVGIALHVAYALAAGGIALASLARPARMRPILGNPLVLVMLAAGLWGTLAGLASATPGLAFAGHISAPEGATQCFGWAALMAALLILRGQPRFRRLIIAATLAFCAVILAILLAVPARSGWDILWTEDFAAFYGIGGGAILAGLLRRRRLGLALGLLLAMAIAIPSSNLTAIAAIIGAAAALGSFFLLTAVLPAARTTWLKRHCIAVATFIAVAAPVAFSALAVITGNLYGTGYRESGAEVSRLYSNWDRARIFDLSLLSLANEPATLIIGNGRGNFGMLLLRYGTELTEVSRRFNEQGKAEEQSPLNWQALNWGYIHSHNYLLEALIGDGIIGLIIAMAGFGVVVLFARKGRLAGAFVFVVAASCLYSTWWALPGTQPFTALGLAALTGGWGRLERFRRGQIASRTDFRQDRPKWRIAAAIGFLALSVVFASLAAIRYQLAERFMEFSGKPETVHTDCSSIPSYGGFGAFHQAATFWRFISDLETAKRDKGPPLPHIPQRALAAICMIDRSAAAGDAYAALNAVFLRGELGLRESAAPIKAELAPLLAGWTRAAGRMLELAPERPDFLIPYFGWAIAEGREPEAAVIAQKLLAKRPADPIGLWFDGLFRLGDPKLAPSAARQMLRAYDGGLRRFMGIGEADVAPLRLLLQQQPADTGR